MINHFIIIDDLIVDARANRQKSQVATQRFFIATKMLKHHDIYLSLDFQVN